MATEKQVFIKIVSRNLLKEIYTTFLSIYTLLFEMKSLKSSIALHAVVTAPLTFTTSQRRPNYYIKELKKKIFRTPVPFCQFERPH